MDTALSLDNQVAKLGTKNKTAGLPLDLILGKDRLDAPDGT